MLPSRTNRRLEKRPSNSGRRSATTVGRRSRGRLPPAGRSVSSWSGQACKGSCSRRGRGALGRTGCRGEALRDVVDGCRTHARGFRGQAGVRPDRRLDVDLLAGGTAAVLPPPEPDRPGGPGPVGPVAGAVCGDVRASSGCVIAGAVCSYLASVTWGLGLPPIASALGDPDAPLRGRLDGPGLAGVRSRACGP